MDWVTAVAGVVPALLTQAGNEWHKRKLKAEQEEALLREREALLREREALAEAQRKQEELLAMHSMQLVALNQQLAEAERKAKLHQDMNETFDKKAAEAWTLYQQAGIMAGNAQTMLLREMDQMVRKLNEYRGQKGEQPIRLRPELQEIVREFKGAHVHNGPPPQVKA